jgi:hypothetical protein
VRGRTLDNLAADVFSITGTLLCATGTTAQPDERAYSPAILWAMSSMKGNRSMMQNGSTVEQTIRSWHETCEELEKVRALNEALGARCKALEEGLRRANEALRAAQEEIKTYMRLAVESVAANNDAANILAASVSRAGAFANGHYSAALPDDVPIHAPHTPRLGPVRERAMRSLEGELEAVEAR